MVARKFVAEWEGPIEGYTVTSVNKSLWRFEGRLEREDLLQEAYLVFIKVRSKYANNVDNPKWFMSLYKTALANKLHDLSKGTKTTSLDSEYVEGEEYSEGYLLKLLEQAPEEVASVLALFTKAPQELLDMAFNSWKQSGGKKITGNQFLNTVLGLNSKGSLAEKTRVFLEVNHD